MNQWQRSLDEFAEKHCTDGSNGIEGKDILFIVSPASGGGNAMRRYPTCLEELKATGRAVEVYVTKSSDDVINLSKSKDLTPYKTIVLLSGDSALYEFLQEPLRTNNGIWPYEATLLLLPGGSSNVIALEDFGPNACVKKIIRQSLSLWKNKKAAIRKASVIQVSSENSTSTCYSLHVCMTGFIKNLLEIAERRREDVYPVFGRAGWVLSILASIPLMANEDDDPTLLNVFNSDTEPGGNFGFGNSRFDKTLTVVLVSKKSNPGKRGTWNLVKSLMRGEVATQHNQGTLPDYVTVERTNKYVYHAPTSGRYHKFYSDGTSREPFECHDDAICFESIPDALPFWTLPDKEDLEAKPGDWDVETTAVLSNCQSVRQAYTNLVSPPNDAVAPPSIVTQLSNGIALEPLHKEDHHYKGTWGPEIKLMETSISDEEQECTFQVFSSCAHGLSQSEVRVCIARPEDGVVIGRVQEKCIKGSWFSSTDADIRQRHQAFLANLDAAMKG